MALFTSANPAAQTIKCVNYLLKRKIAKTIIFSKIDNLAQLDTDVCGRRK